MNLDNSEKNPNMPALRAKRTFSRRFMDNKWEIMVSIFCFVILMSFFSTARNESDVYTYSESSQVPRLDGTTVSVASTHSYNVVTHEFRQDKLVTTITDKKGHVTFRSTDAPVTYAALKRPSPGLNVLLSIGIIGCLSILIARLVTPRSSMPVVKSNIALLGGFIGCSITYIYINHVHSLTVPDWTVPACIVSVLILSVIRLPGVLPQDEARVEKLTLNESEIETSG